MTEGDAPSIRPSVFPSAGRIVGIDPGERRIGVALSDESQTLAQPLTTLTRRAGKRVPLRHLLTIVQEQQVVGVVVGLPLESDGREGESASAARALAGDIARHGQLPVELLDERMTTARVLRAVREMGGRTRGRKAELDALAATLVLQQFLDARRGTGT